MSGSDDSSETVTLSLGVERIVFFLWALKYAYKEWLYVELLTAYC